MNEFILMVETQWVMDVQPSSEINWKGNKKHGKRYEDLIENSSFTKKKKKIAFLHTVCNMVKYFICTSLGLLLIKVRLFLFYDFCKYASCFL